MNTTADILTALDKHESECVKRHGRVITAFDEVRADIADLKADVGEVKESMARVESYIRGKEG